MAKQVLIRRGTTAQHAAFTGALGEITLDTDRAVLVAHDGVTAGGHPQAKESVLVADGGAYFPAAGDSITNDTAALQTALNGTQGILRVMSDCYIAGNLTINGTTLVGPGRLIGPGTIAGVVGNTEIPYDVIAIWNNVVTKTARTTATDTADIIIDPLLGNDTNVGSSALPVKTLTRALVLSAALVGGRSTDIIIAVRSGRLECSNVVIPANAAFSNNLARTFNGYTETFENADIYTIDTDPNRLFIRSHVGEVATVSAPTHWMFTSQTNLGSKLGHVKVANPLGAAFFEMYSGKTGVSIPCAGTYENNYLRSQTNYDVGISARGAGGYWIDIGVDPQTLAEYSQLSPTEIGQTRFRITQWFSSSWHNEEVSLTGNTLRGVGYTTAESAAYYNGWRYINSATANPSAPYFAENLWSCLVENSFASYADGVYLPSTGETAFYTVDPTVSILIDSTLAKNVRFSGLKVAGLTGTPLAMSQSFNQETSPAYALELGDKTAVQDCKFSNISGTAVLLYKFSSVVKNCTFDWIGDFGIRDTYAGSHYSGVIDNVFTRIGYAKQGGWPIYQSGENITVRGNSISRSTGGIALGSKYKAPTSVLAGPFYGQIYDNLVTELGTFSGEPNQRYMNDDYGAINVAGFGQRSYYDFFNNVVITAYANNISFGFYGDGGASGIRLANNVFAGARSNGVSIRDVTFGLDTNSNIIDNNLIIGGSIIGSSTTDATKTAYINNYICGTDSVNANATNTENVYDTASPFIKVSANAGKLKYTSDEILTYFTAATQIIKTKTAAQQAHLQLTSFL